MAMHADSDKNMIEVFGDAAALKFVKFDPTVEIPPLGICSKIMVCFLNKHFDHCIMKDKRTTIMADFSNQILQYSKLLGWTKPSRTSCNRKGEIPILDRKDPV